MSSFIKFYFKIKIPVNFVGLAVDSANSKAAFYMNTYPSGDLS